MTNERRLALDAMNTEGTPIPDMLAKAERVIEAFGEKYPSVSQYDRDAFDLADWYYMFFRGYRTPEQRQADRLPVDRRADGGDS